MLQPRCPLCLVRTTTEELLCKRCQTQILRFKAEGCQRCGVARCTGCRALPEFVRIESLFQLHKANANTLVDAKDRQLAFAIELVRTTFLPSFLERIETFAKHFECDVILLSPLRVSRIFGGGWHLLQDVFEALQKNVSVVFPVLLSARHSLLPTNLRLARHRVSILWKTSLREVKKAHRILLVDDVLTSGSTALTVQNFYKRRGAEANWYFVSLFRTPQTSNDSS